MKNKKVEKLAEDFINLSNEEKQEFVKRVRTHWPDWECKKYENQKTTIANVKELQERMVQLCIDFIKEYELDDIQEVRFSADMLQESKKYGEWTGATDSFINVYGLQTNEYGLEERRIIGEYY